MKIAINNYCNSKCPYCFAGNMGIDQKSNITLENFRKLLDIMVINKDNFLTVLGGEPTLHPQFREIWEMVNEYQRMFNWKVLLLTNAVKLNDFLDIINKDTHILINVNCEEVLNKKQFEMMKNSLKGLRLSGYFDYRDENGSSNIVLGCNLHLEHDDYDYFWNLVDIVNARKVRVSVTSPTNNKDALANRDWYFRQMKDKFLDFVCQAYNRQLYINLDCSEIPPCYFTATELFLISKVTGGDMNSLGHCGPMFQVMPDMSVSCCFGDSDFSSQKKYITDFENLRDVQEYYDKQRTSRIKDCYHMEVCKNCILKEMRLCFAGCFGFTDGRCVECSNGK